MTVENTAEAAPSPQADEEERHRLTTLSGLAALSLDALSSVAYGPEAIVIVLVAAGTAGLAYTLPVTAAIVVLLALLVVSYRQVIAAFPGGGGAYAVASAHLGRTPSLVAAASLIVDYVLNAAAGVGKGAAFYFIQLVTMLLLALAANTSFGGLPVLASQVTVAADPAQPARLRARPGHPQRHGQRGHLPAALPADDLAPAARPLTGVRACG
jgi:amino acid transporter